MKQSQRLTQLDQLAVVRGGIPACAPCILQGSASGWAFDTQQDVDDRGCVGLDAGAGALDEWRAREPMLEQTLGSMLALMTELAPAAVTHALRLSPYLVLEPVDLEGLDGAQNFRRSGTLGCCTLRYNSKRMLNFS